MSCSNKERGNFCWIAIGSNSEAFENIKKAQNYLLELFLEVQFSKLVKTLPIGLLNPSFFLNQVACIKTNYSQNEVLYQLKEIEKKIGRKLSDKEVIKIDLDLLIFNGKIIKGEDIKRDYVRRGLEELKKKMKKNRFIGIIPARYASTRFPAKPLAVLGGKKVIQHVYEQVSKVLDDVYVATDDQRIVEAVETFGGKVVLTSSLHKSGTDRCCEAVKKVADDFDVVINVQGDEPFIQPLQLNTLMNCFNDEETQIATLVKPFNQLATWVDLHNPNTPKVVIDSNNFAIYFSRSVIPYLRGVKDTLWLKKHTYYKHIGLYAYRLNVLNEITKLPQSTLEVTESLEQLRWIENGYKIKVGKTNVETIGIDTPEDLVKAEQHLEQLKKENEK